jgi:hypothetical protein
MPAATDLTSRLTPYVQELLENEYARDNLREGADRLRGAYERSQKRRVKAARDEKLRHQLEAAATSLGIGAKALASGRRKPARRRRKALLALLAGVAIGGAVALAAHDDLRASLLGSGADADAEPGGNGTQA